MGYYTVENASTMVALVVLVLLSGAAVGEAKSLVVGGTAKWNFGINYTDWAHTSAPFHVGDSLVFSYEPFLLGNETIYHNVYVFKDLAHYKACNFQNATLLAGPMQGKPGFEYVLKDHGWYHFGCSIKNGFHCKVGGMHFKLKAGLVPDY